MAYFDGLNSYSVQLATLRYLFKIKVELKVDIKTKEQHPFMWLIFSCPYVNLV